ncbi:Crp/Fnr family transcriptional regulator [Dyadobacter psychrotolerans]|uniref:Crp/Fnr family transcriptional regulator n=1 Tax=Dyadobacter psychrotolerans TaxID=2541721 RepID=A0A4R5E2J8_9BACT|nr:Crp/Fnr family transcriptional regulator [Dyadobacter psychrotolerans]TDE18363.1 Crp/Fnr family transcriptional regulator [Dyadobacter psychrotolerans]
MKNTSTVQELSKILRQSETFSSLWLKPRFFSNGKILTDVGDVSHNLYLIEKGVMRAYYERKQSDITAWMVSDGNIACIADSFLMRSPSSVGLETLEDTWAYPVSYEQYCSIREHDSMTASLVISLFENYLVLSQKRIELLRYNSVEERIAKYLQHSASLFRRIPDRYIATFLGTTESTFCKCLKRILREH